MRLCLLMLLLFLLPRLQAQANSPSLAQTFEWISEPLFQSCKTDSVGSVCQCFMLRQSLGRITNRPSVSLNRSSPMCQSR
jgi:hypothetical protein